MSENHLFVLLIEDMFRQNHRQLHCESEFEYYVQYTEYTFLNDR